MKLVCRTIYDIGGPQEIHLPKGAVPLGVQGVPHFAGSGGRTDITINGNHTSLVSGYDSVFASIVILFEADYVYGEQEVRTFYVVRPEADLFEHTHLIGTTAEPNGTVRAVFIQERVAPCMWCGMMQAESEIQDHEAACR